MSLNAPGMFGLGFDARAELHLWQTQVVVAGVWEGYEVNLTPRINTTGA